MNISLQKTEFGPNEEVLGSITMTLDKPRKSRGVVVSLTSDETRRAKNSKGQQVTEHYTRIWASQTLDVEREYQAGQSSYQFRLMTPDRSAPVSLLGMVWKGAIPTGKSYKVDAKLDIEKGFDINDKKEIRVNYR